MFIELFKMSSSGSKLQSKPGILRETGGKKTKTTVLPNNTGRNTASNGGSTLYTVLCLSTIAVLVVGGGIALVVVGTVRDNEDSLIIGGLFLGLGTVFLLVMFISFFKPFGNKRKNRVDNKEEFADDDIKGYLKGQDTEIYPPAEVMKRSRPSNAQLYGNEKLSIHLPGPEVVPRSPSPTFPKPPKVAYPNNILEGRQAPVKKFSLRALVGDGDNAENDISKGDTVRNVEYNFKKESLNTEENIIKEDDEKEANQQKLSEKSSDDGEGQCNKTVKFSLELL